MRGLDIAFTFPMDDTASARLMVVKAECLHSAGVIGAGESGPFSVVRRPSSRKVCAPLRRLISLSPVICCGEHEVCSRIDLRGDGAECPCRERRRANVGQEPGR
jgi:hypothetical protein